VAKRGILEPDGMDSSRLGGPLLCEGDDDLGNKVIDGLLEGRDLEIRSER